MILGKVFLLFQFKLYVFALVVLLCNCARDLNAVENLKSSKYFFVHFSILFLYKIFSIKMLIESRLPARENLGRRNDYRSENAEKL